MSLRDFIKANRAEIDGVIRRATGPKETTMGYQGNLRLTDDERRLWILNDEGLYSWARAEGVRI